MRNKNLLKYSAAQEEAIKTFDKEVCVTAGAGSGKTNLLVERFLYAVTEKNIEPDRILAITFTEKAANEMKRRLVSTLAGRGLDEIRQKLENAWISTIHSFCARLLKENPIEAGVDPNFQILAEGETELLMEKVMDELFQAEAHNGRWIEMLVDTGEGALRDELKDFYFFSQAMLENKAIFEIKDFSEEEQALGRRIQEDVRVLLKQGKAGEILSELLEILEMNDEHDWKKIRRLEELEGKLGRRTARDEGLKSVKRSLSLLKSFIAQRLALPAKREFLSQFFRFKERYESEKKARAFYDFEDLLSFAYRLLSSDRPQNKKVRARYQEFFKAILVDEFQDTSPLQANLVELLKKSGNLFRVGDRRQSIYGFRYADPLVFERVLEKSEGSDSVKRISLAENYRSRPEILSFVNSLFGSCKKDLFKPLVSKRFFSTPAGGCIEFLCVERNQENPLSMGQARVLEAKTLARRIHELVEQEKICVEEGGVVRPMEYRDIAVLFKNTTSSHLYEKELSEMNVPFYAVKGRGFFDKQEIKDLMNALQFLENPDLDIPLAGVLRSPLAGLTDDALFWLAQASKKEDRQSPLSRSLEASALPKELSCEDLRRLGKFNAWTRELRSSKNKFKISELLEIILRKTHYETKLLTKPGGRQRLANILKLVSLARELEEKGLTGSEDFVTFLRRLSEKEILEAEAKVKGEDENVVTLSTIHAAKGLEFPCVILADMGSEGLRNRHGHFLSTPELGLGARLKKPWEPKYLEDASYLEIEEALNRKEDAENDRLLYVALTRAKERLILSGSKAAPSEKKKESGNLSWMDKAAAAIDSETRILSVKGETPVLTIENSRPPAVPDLKALSDLFPRFVPVVKPYEEKSDRSVSYLLETVKDSDRVPRFFSEEFSVPRDEFGTCFHRVMEFLVRSRKKPISNSFFDMPSMRFLDSEAKKEIKQSVLRLWKGPLGKAIRSAKSCYPELPFIYKTPQGLLKGQIDLVYQLKNGEWAILDYKTNRLERSAKEVLAKSYEFQISCYAFVFAKLYGKCPKKGILYFSSIDETAEFSYESKTLESFEKELAEAWNCARTSDFNSGSCPSAGAPSSSVTIVRTAVGHPASATPRKNQTCEHNSTS